MFTKRIFIVILSLVLFVSAVLPKPALAWDCSAYQFTIDTQGNVLVQNLSANNEPPQSAKVYVNGVLVTTVSVPPLSAGTGWLAIGIVSVQPGDSWRVHGTSDCENSGQFPLLPPPPTDEPPGNTLVCVTIDKGDLWGRLEIWHSNEAGDKLDGFDGYAEINADGALTVFANPGEDRQGYFLVIDEHGTSALFYIEVGMRIDCPSPLNHDCQRIYPVTPRDHDCDCEVKRA